MLVCVLETKSENCRVALDNAGSRTTYESAPKSHHLRGTRHEFDKELLVDMLTYSANPDLCRGRIVNGYAVVLSETEL